jgi:hypothetical protein
VKEKKLNQTDIECFTFQRELESQHEDTTEKVSDIVGERPCL